MRKCWWRGVIAGLLAGITLVAYWPVRHAQFVSYDDGLYVTKNVHVQTGLTATNIAWAFSTRPDAMAQTANWHPLTWLSHMLDAQLFGMRAGGHHFTSVLLHAANTLLLFFLLGRMTGAFWRAALVAGLFALHPLHVESVAWVAERKDVLSGFFFLLTLLAWERYANNFTGGNRGNREGREAGGRKTEVQSPKSEVRSPAVAEPLRSVRSFAATRSLSWYVAALGCFALGLMSKPMLVTLPFILLLLDFWPFRRLQLVQSSRFKVQGSRFSVLLVEKLPFFALALVSSLATMAAQKAGGAVQNLHLMPMSSRMENALVAYARYLGKTFWPFDLAAPYPHPGHWPLGWVAAAAVLLVGLTALAWRLRGKAPYLLVGWLWFGGMLVPVIGLVQVGDQSMADRYMYLPMIGVLVGVVWGAMGILQKRMKTGILQEATERTELRGSQEAAASLPSSVSSVSSREISLALLSGLLLLGCFLRTRNQVRVWHDSLSLFGHAVTVTQGNFLAWYNLGWNLSKQGRIDEAIACYRKSAEIQPKYLDAWNNLGVALADKKQYTEAARCFETVLRQDARDFDARQNLGVALLESGKTDDAIAEFRQALALKPNATKTLNRLGTALAGKGEFAEAAAVLGAALRADPAQPATQYGLANALARLRRLDEAIEHYQLALKYKPDYPEAEHDLGLSLARRGRFAEAEAHLREAVRARPGDAAMRCNLGKVLMAEQRIAEAIPVYEEAVKLSPTNGEAQASLGLAYAIRGNLDAAIEHLRKAIELRPGDALAHFNLGKALASQGKTQEAIPQYQEALRLRPDYAQARQELEALGAKF